jgi:beclin 1
MASTAKTQGHFCQKCRTPIEVDPSIDQLNPAAFKLLIGNDQARNSPSICSHKANKQLDSTVPGQQQTAKNTGLRQSRPAYPSARHQAYQGAAQSARNPTFKRSVPPSRFSQHGAHNPAMSFINVHMSESMLDTHSAAPTAMRQTVPESADSNGVEMTRRASVTGAFSTSAPNKIADGMETTTRMFEILSARSDIDHPICSECTELLVDSLQKRLAVAGRERDAYVDYLRRANSDVPSAEEIKQAEDELEVARNSEAAAMAKLEQLEADKEELDKQLSALETEARQLDRTESEFWMNRNAFATSLKQFQNERDALTTKHAHDMQILMQLQRRSVYNDTFFITHDNYYATINGLRLGRLSTPYVDWPEINAAWGQTCLLLATLAERLNYKFQGYELCPMGSTSTILKLENKGSTTSSGNPTPNTANTVTKQRLELYSSGELPFNLGFMHRKFDTAMVAFLECLRQLGDFAEKSPGYSDLKMPYEIKKDKIHDHSIKLSLSKEENWTKACKYVLTCCKFLLAHANNNENAGARRR